MFMVCCTVSAILDLLRTIPKGNGREAGANQCYKCDVFDLGFGRVAVTTTIERGVMPIVSGLI
jgi:hypothetical protein